MREAPKWTQQIQPDLPQTEQIKVINQERRHQYQPKTKSEQHPKDNPSDGVFDWLEPELRESGRISPLLWVAIANDYCTLQGSVKRILLRGPRNITQGKAVTPYVWDAGKKSATQLMFAALTFR